MLHHQPIRILGLYAHAGLCAANQPTRHFLSQFAQVQLVGCESRHKCNAELRRLFSVIADSQQVLATALAVLMVAGALDAFAGPVCRSRPSTATL